MVTVNSATLVNKGLEVIEAHLLFGIPFDRVAVVDTRPRWCTRWSSSTTGPPSRASPPSMMIPIALGMAWPDRVPDVAPAVDWTRPETWEFFPLDDEAFPMCAWPGGGEPRRHRPAVYNAANEVCVAAFWPARCVSPTS